MIDKTKIKKAADPIYDPPHNSEWIIGIDAWGYVFIVKAPNIHPSFLEYKNAEEIGIPYEMPEEKPGIYKMSCRFHESHDIESGMVDDYGFECEELKVLAEYT